MNQDKKHSVQNWKVNLYKENYGIQFPRISLM